MRVFAAALGILLFGSLHAASYEAGDVTVFIFEEGRAAPGVRIAVDGEQRAATDNSGAADISTSPGAHVLQLSRGGTELAEIAFDLDTDESAEISVALTGIGREPRIRISKFDSAEALGTIEGVVRDPNGAPLSGATVSPEGLAVSTTSAADGSYSLEVPRGVYDLSVTHPDFPERRFTGVRALASLGGEIDLALRARQPDAGGAIEEVVAVGRYVPDTAFASERESESVLDVITEQEISLAGDSTAAAALQRVTGVTIQDDFVFVRGLGDRFSSTLLNGAEIPSPDPARRAIGLDIFPTDLVGGISVQKTYTPDLPGDFSGGAVRLRTRGIPEEFTGRIGVSTGANSRSTFQRGLTHAGGDYDFLGFDDGSRDVPDVAAQLTNNGQRPLNELSPEENERVAESIPRVYNLRGLDLPMDTGIEGSLGGRTRLGDVDVGLNFAAIYDQEWRYREEERAVVDGITGAGRPNVASDGTLQRTENDVTTGAVFGATGDFGPATTIDFVSLLSRQTTKGTFLSQRVDRSGGENNEIRQVDLEFIETQLLSNQLSGEHELGILNGATAGWQVVYSNAERDEPLTRTYSYSRSAGSDETFRLTSGPGTGGLPPVFKWEYLEDDTLDLGTDLALPTRFGALDGELKLGLRATQRDREYDITRWRFNLTPEGSRDETLQAALAFPSPEMIFTPGRIGPEGFELVNATTPAPGGGNADSYDAEQDLFAGYLMGDFYIGNAYRVQAGARIEDSDILVTSRAVGGAGGVAEGRNEETDILPALNVTWFINDISQLRAGLSQTVNRPQFRELSPAQFRDPETRFETFGNPDLEQTTITSADLRYERYASGNEGFTVAVFYKDFQDPIEVITRGGGQGGQGVRTFVNSESAELYGLELDGRYNLDSLGAGGSFLQDFYVAGNLALIESDVTIGEDNVGVLTNDSRRLQGQSPWVANLSLGYSNPLSQTDALLLLNVFGERIDGLGILGAPDAKEQPRPVLDFNLSQRFLQNWKVGLKLRDILDSEFEIKQGSVVQRSYRAGRSLSVSLGYDF